MNKKLLVTFSPHVRSEDSTRVIMADVIIALIPALIVGCYYFGFRALTITLISVVACVGFEFLYRKLLHKSSSIGDLSAVVTGMLIAFNLPASVPLWMPVVGAFLAIVVVKQLYGGIGKNVMNPALIARAFLMSWPALMTVWPAPFSKLSPLAVQVDTVSSATALVSLKAGTTPSMSILDMFLGNMPGCIGEVSSLVLILGGVYLLYRRIITWHIPVAYIGTVALLTLVFPRTDDGVGFMLSSIFSGGLMLGAIFMATDYTTSPVGKGGRILYGIGCGLLTVFIRYFGGYPEGVSYSILVMNALVWIIDRYVRPGKPKLIQKLEDKAGARKAKKKETIAAASAGGEAK